MDGPWKNEMMDKRSINVHLRPEVYEKVTASISDQFPFRRIHFFVYNGIFASGADRPVPVLSPVRREGGRKRGKDQRVRGRALYFI